MNSSQIDFICSKLDPVIRPYFRGVFSLDNLILYGDEYLNLEEINVIIFNSQPSDSEGAHWLLLVISSGWQNVVFFNSFANPPEFYSIALAKFMGEGVVVSPYRVQGDSIICALYCILVAHFLSKGKDLDPFIRRSFSPYNLSDNDNSVIEWASEREYGGLLKETCLSELEPCLNYEQVKNGASRDDR